MWKFIFFAILIISSYGYSEASEVIDKDSERLRAETVFASLNTTNDPVRVPFYIEGFYC